MDNQSTVVINNPIAISERHYATGSTIRDQSNAVKLGYSLWCRIDVTNRTAIDNEKTPLFLLVCSQAHSMLRPVPIPRFCIAFAPIWATYFASSQVKCFWGAQRCRCRFTVLVESPTPPPAAAAADIIWVSIVDSKSKRRLRHSNNVRETTTQLLKPSSLLRGLTTHTAFWSQRSNIDIAPGFFCIQLFTIRT